jgi:Na+-driven multidrug efflux pump
VAGPAGGNAAPPASTSILRLSAPLVLSFWMRAAFSFVDTAYAATLGDAAVAGIGLAIPLEFLFIACWVGVSNGLTSLISQALGAGESARIEQLKRTAWTLITRALMPAFLVLAAAVWLTAPHLGLDPDVARQFAIYAGVTLAGSALTAFWSILPDSVVKAHHDTRSTMWAGIWSNVINVVLNTVFVFGFGWGMFGIAFSTVLGRLGGLIYALRKARAHEEARRRRETAPSPRLEPHPHRALLALAIPSALAYSFMALESSVVNAILAATPDAKPAIAAYSIYYRLVMFALMPMIAASVAILPYTARHFGRGDLATVRSGLREIGLAATAYSILLVAPLAWFGGPPLARLLAEEPATAEFAGFALRVIPLACLASIPLFICRPVFEGMQRARPGLWVAILRYLILAGPFALAGARLARAFGIPDFHGLVLALVAASALASLIFHLWLSATLKALAGTRATAHGGAPA